MTVWCVHPIKGDLRPAEAYGKIRYVNTRYIYPDDLEEAEYDQKTYFPPQAVEKLYVQAAQQFQPNTDYLLIAGDHLQLLMFTGELCAMWSKFKVLRYDRQEQGYIAVELNPNTARGA